MSGKLLQAVWDYSGDDLTCNQKHVLARMAWYASDAGRDVFPSVKRLCDQTNISRRAMFEILAHLKERGFILSMGTSNRSTKIYYMNLGKLGVIDEFGDHSSTITVQKDQCATRTPTSAPGAPPPVRQAHPIDIHKHYVKNHDHNDVKKTNVEPREKVSIKERLRMLSYEEKHEYGCLKRFKGLYDSVALSIVEQNTLGDIRNAIEMATTAAIDNPGAYIVKALYNKGVKGGASEGTQSTTAH